MSIALRVRPYVESDPDGTFDSRYYTKAEVDAMVASISAASHDHDDRYFTETESTAALALKADVGHTHDDRYYTEGEVDASLALKAASTHTHDDRYYTKSETGDFLALKAPLAHTHPWSEVTGKPITFSGQNEASFNNYLSTAGPHTLASLNIGPLVNGQRYLIVNIGEISFDGADGTAGDLTLSIFLGGTSYPSIDTSRAEGGVDTGYTIVKSVYYTGTGGTVAAELRGTVVGGTVNTRYARLSVIAIPVSNP